MSRRLSAEEARQQYIAAMGEQGGKIFYALYSETALAYLHWRESKELFGTSTERVDLLNRGAGSFFALLQRTMREDVLLRLVRLTDGPRDRGGHQNLTIKRLPTLVVSEPAAVKNEVNHLLAIAMRKTAFARGWRDRWIAHYDLALAMRDENAAPLAPATRRDIDEALAAISAALNRVQVAVLGTAPMRYEEIITDHGSAESLLYLIRDGLEAREAQKRRLKDGTAGPEDYGPPRPV